MSDATRTAPIAKREAQSAASMAPAEQTVREVGRLMEHLRGQLEELDRREANLNRQLVSFDNERRAMRLAAQQAEQQAEQRAELLNEREQAVAARENECQTQEAETLEQRTAIAAAEETLASDRATFREQVIGEFAAERESLEASKQSHDQREAAIAAGEASLAQQGIDLEKRTRFHEEHLNRLRREVAEQKSEVERERQRLRTWSNQVDDSIRFRLAHIRKFRDLLDRREQSLETEAEILREQRESMERDLARQHQEAAAEEAALIADSEKRQADFRSQQDLLTLHSENLEGRRQRLDKMRDELDQSHQDALELRMAAEQVHAEVVQATDAQAAQDRIQAARESLFEYYRDLRESLTQRRQEADDAQRSLQAKRDEFHAERDAQIQRIAEREQQISLRERQSAELNSENSVRETTWIAAREGWREDQLEAERVIRELLQQLEAAVAPEDQAWPTGSAFGSGPDQADQERPVSDESDSAAQAA